MSINFPSEDEKITTAQDLNCPIEVLTKLGGDESHYVRLAVANNPNTPIGTLIDMDGYEDEDEDEDEDGYEDEDEDEDGYEDEDLDEDEDEDLDEETT